MLVLTRRIGEEIIIGNDIRVKIVAIKGDRIRIGIDAPEEVSVDRAEIFARRQEFIEIPLGVSHANSIASADDNHHGADVPLGELPITVSSSAETLRH